MTRLHRCALAIAVCALVATGCGAADSASNGQQATASTVVDAVPAVAQAASADDTTTTTATTTTATTTTTTAAIATTTPIAQEITDCDTDRRTLEVAVEAYVARTGALPASQDDLVGGYLHQEITSHRLDRDGRVTPREGMPCVSPDPSSDRDEPSTVDDWLEAFGDEFVEDSGGLECATEVARIFVAAAAFLEREGREPADLDDLAGDLEAPLELWSFDPDTDSLVPIDGSGCIDPTQDEPWAGCDKQRRILEVATEAYAAMENAPPTDQDALLDAGLIRERAPDFEIVDGAVAVLPGTECSALLAELDTREPGPYTEADCDVDFRTLSVAIDAYHTATGRYPDNEQQLVDGGFIRDTSPMWDVVYGNLFPADGSNCDDPDE